MFGVNGKVKCLLPFNPCDAQRQWATLDLGPRRASSSFGHSGLRCINWGVWFGQHRIRSTSHFVSLNLIKFDANADESVEKGRPISGVLATANSCTVIGPARKPLRPALTAAEKALAICTGSIARETAEFTSTPSKPHSIT